METYKIYKDQTKIKFTSNLGVDLTGATVTIKIKKDDPTATEVEKPAVIDNAVNGDVSFIPLTGDVTTIFPTQGVFIVWYHITFSDARTAPTRPFKIKINLEGY